MPSQAVFHPFTNTHWLTLLAMSLLGSLILVLPRLLPGKNSVQATAYGVAFFMILQELIDRAGHHFLNNEPLSHILPLHMCGASVFLVPIMLVTRSFALFEILYFWGIGGATVSLVTPDVSFPFPHFLTITFFTSHTLIIVGVLYGMIYYGLRPTAWSVPKVLLITALYAAAIALLNLLLKANYLYICEKPAGLSILDFLGPWPWYLFGMAIITIFVFVLLYLPCLILDLARKHAGHPPT